MRENEDLVKITEVLDQLKDYFEAQGKMFIIGYAFKENIDDVEFVGNLVSTSAKDTDYYAWATRMAERACRYIDQQDTPNWKNSNPK